jgi:o-succinylbenzoate---CoA ligase
MRKQRLILDNVSYLLSDIQQDNFQHSKNSETSALTFCRDWLNGKENFTLQTSGSTGSPKKISASRDQLQASSEITVNYLELKKEHNALVCLDIHYIAGIMMLVRSLETGMDIYVVDPTANPFAGISSSTKIDFAALVPYQVQAILKSEGKHRFNEGVFLIGGAPLPKKTIDELKSFSGTFYATYGMTETLSHIALQRLNGENQEKYFQVLAGISIRIDERGCLVILAPHINPDPITTNDLVELIDHNKFIWLGRADTIINSGGVKIIPEKIERAIELIFEEFKIENRFFIAGLPHPKLGEAVTLLIEGEKLSKDKEQLIVELTKTNLGKYEIPKSILYIPSFVQTETGKISKIKTLELFKQTL